MKTKTDKDCHKKTRTVAESHYFPTDKKGSIKNGQTCSCGKKKWAGGRMVDNK